VYGEKTESQMGVIESSFLGLKLKAGDKLLPRLNIGGKPIANKYCEGKMKRTLKRELKDLKPLKRKR
jgi:small ligand-binding sensory domain FIST